MMDFFGLFWIVIAKVTFYYDCFKPKKPLKTLDDYISKAYDYFLSSSSKQKKAIEIMKSALENLELNDEEECRANLIIGNFYFEGKEFKEANAHYEVAVNFLLGMDFYYSKELINIIQSYTYTDQKERATGLYYNFLQRQYFDKSFKKIEKYKKQLGI